MTHLTRQKRSGSTVQRHELDGQAVFTKDYRRNGWRDTHLVLNQRTARETEVIRRLAALPGMSNRLGRQIVVESDPSAARIVTEEVSGANLQSLLLESSPRGHSGDCTRALEIAGRWLKEFQSMSTDSHTAVDDSVNPTNLIKYCQLRLEALAEHGSSWATPGRRDRIELWVENQVGVCDDSDLLPCWSHGDYGPTNMIWDGYRLTPIDFATARLDLPLVDVTYLVHRLEMLAIQFPWRPWPLALWRRAIIRGYAGDERLLDRPIYRTLMVRHGLCRLLTLARERSRRVHQRLHDRYVRQRVQKLIEGLIQTS